MFILLSGLGQCTFPEEFKRFIDSGLRSSLTDFVALGVQPKNLYF